MKLFTNNLACLRKTTDGSIGIDIMAVDYKVDFKKNIVKYYTKVSIQVDRNDVSIELRPRSSVYKKSNIGCLANSIGTIDLDYTGEILVIFRLHFKSWFERMLIKLGLKKLDIYDIGDYIGQLVFTKAIYPSDIEIRFKDKKELEEYSKQKYKMSRLNNGFGSTSPL